MKNIPIAKEIEEYDNLYTFNYKGNPFYFFFYQTDDNDIHPVLTRVPDDDYPDAHGDVIIPSSIIYNHSEYTLNLLNEYTFCDNSNITSIEFPIGFQYIGKQALNACDNLTSISLPPTITCIEDAAFADCTSLREVYVPAMLEELNTSIFENCTSLQQVFIPDSLTTIGNQVFANCTSLRKLTLPSSLTSLSQNALSNTDIKLTNNSPNFRLINNALYDIDRNRICYIPNSLTNFKFPNEITNTIPAKFFAFANLHQLTIPEGITSIKSDAFFDCQQLQTITLPSTLKEISYYAFIKCHNAQIINHSPHFHLDNGVLFNSDRTRIYYFPNTLTHYTIPNTISTIGPLQFSDCRSLEQITIPNTVTAIHKSAFLYCTNLTKIVIPDSVVMFESSIFAGCENLTSIKLPNQLFEIPSQTFAGCTSLRELILPPFVDTIESEAFLDCDNLEHLWIQNPTFDYNCEPIQDLNQYVHIYIGPNQYCLSNNGEKSHFTEPYPRITEQGFIPNLHVTQQGLPFPIYFTINDNEATIEHCPLTTTPTQTHHLTIPSQVNYNGHHYPVKYINHFAFYNCDNIESITIPDSITAIGHKAFAYSPTLKKVTMGNSVTFFGDGAFLGCYNLQSITLSQSLYRIPSQAFNECRSLTKIILPPSVQHFDSHAFYGCDNLQGIWIQNSEPYTVIPQARDLYLPTTTALYFGPDQILLGDDESNDPQIDFSTND